MRQLQFLVDMFLRLLGWLKEDMQTFSRRQHQFLVDMFPGLRLAKGRYVSFARRQHKAG
jgi:hypothetical protein